MKNSIVYVLAFVFLICLGSCKEKAKQTAQSEGRDSTLVAQENQDTALGDLYVMVPNGLSLRADNALDSEKLAVMPFRSRVVLLQEAADTSLEVEHIKGGMHMVRYKGQTGYAFSGFLSHLPMPEEEEEGNEVYIAKLKENYSEVTFVSKPNDPDFHEGTTDTFTLPATSWHEAFYIVAAMYELPETLAFPNPSGPELETFEDPDKPQEVWDSFLTVNRENNALKKIEYYYRAEGFGYGVDIQRKSENLFQIEYLGFVD
ncbi:SH3 domain-containing protein [Aggregatimonas sangjinii]|uniref:SH3 domain-containing protein n=1 Tax=Aggregatimonas sangjinii TaxID=2583587 RepID=A0A5B7SXM7_9FLAO|nr:SH3 domain-containing protein [Aggregatimonas sangjinii]QCX01544.1 SH3 domain-containing protein [Aggregatimonas sangjinii]